DWLSCILASRELQPRAKLVASAIHLEFFSYEKFLEDGQLWAWPSSRTLDKRTGQSKNTVKKGIEELKAKGFLEATTRWNIERNKYDSNLYRARIPDRISKADRGVGQASDLGWVTRVNQGGSDVSPRVGQAGGQYSLNDSLNDSE